MNYVPSQDNMADVFTKPMICMKKSCKDNYMDQVKLHLQGIELIVANKAI